MPSLRRLPKGALVLVCDARKGLFLRNAGTEIHPSLEVVRTVEAGDVTSERDLQGNAPGRKPDSHPGDGTHGPKSAMEPPDYARLDAEKFAAHLAAEAANLGGSGAEDGIVVAAPPRMLGALRDALPADLRRSLLAEIAKDLTPLPADELAGHLVAEW